jgi:hypothetical protein
MRRALVISVAFVAMAIATLEPAAAATPISVAGTAKVVVDKRTTPISYKKRQVTVATVSNAGTLSVPNVYTGAVTCVRSAVRNGVKGVVLSAAKQGDAETFMLINEGGGPNDIHPWALVVQAPAARFNGGECGTSVTAAWVAAQSPPGHNVAAAAFTVVGG